MFESLLKPMTLLMDKLSYKRKISVFFTIILLPLLVYVSFIFFNIQQEREVLKSKMVGLEYNGIFINLLRHIPKHRGAMDAYLSGDKSFKKDILKSEKYLSQDFEMILNFDKKNLMLYKDSKLIENLMKSWEALKYDKISTNTNAKHSNIAHTKLIEIILNEMKRVSNLTGFSKSIDIDLNYIETILSDKLPLLGENVGQARGLGAGILARKEVALEDKRDSLHLYATITSSMDSIKAHHSLTKQKNYEKTELKIKSTNNSLITFLNSYNNHIINTQELTLNPKNFFKNGTKVLQHVFDLYDQLAITYQSIIVEKIEKIENKFAQYLLIFLVSTAVLLYLFAAFYLSIMSGLKKLQDASLQVANGNTNVQINHNTNDELGEVINSFNFMGNKIRTNMSFLSGYKMAIDESSIVSKANKKGIITYINDKFCELSGYRYNELIGKPHSVIRHPDMPKEAFKQMWATLKDKKVWHGKVKNRRKDGEAYFVDATIIPILDELGEIYEYVAVRHDITELENKKEELKKQRTDLLTGLANRNQMLEDLVTIKNPVMMLININSFGELNDFYGSQVGDRVLIELSMVLNKIAKSSRVDLYKLHADEFAILNDLGSFSHDDYVNFVSKIIKYVEANKIKYEENQISLSVTAGISFGDELDAKKELTSLIQTSSSALKSAKKANKKYLVYDESMQKKNDYANNMLWIETIKDAIANDRIVIYFQPIIDNKTAKANKYESLVRLIKEDGSVVSPFFFLDIAKKANLYSQITKIVIQKSFDTFRDLPYEFSINLSPEDIEDYETTKFVKKSLQNFNEPSRVIFEIVESEEIADYSKVSDFIKEIKSFGAKVAIDDFGSGYSNFEHILALDADYLKIDGSLVKNIDKDEDAKIITKAIISFCKKLNRKTIVEFVHNEDVYNIAKEMGADYSQGFYLGEPKDKPELFVYEEKEQALLV